MTVYNEKLISCAAQSPMEKTGCRKLENDERERPGLKI